uniref:Uncharacterized protein n=1 Tax=Anguilla anguilla TaxID=7936 RepID=A0A0E9SA21_ANGAN
MVTALLICTHSIPVPQRQAQWPSQLIYICYLEFYW